jgi:hypothetical protein
MAKKKVVEVESDDLDDYGSLEDAFMSREIIIGKYMEDISEILSQAYGDIEDKVNSLLEDLDDK